MDNESHRFISDGRNNACLHVYLILLKTFRKHCIFLKHTSPNIHLLGAWIMNCIVELRCFISSGRNNACLHVYLACQHTPPDMDGCRGY